MKGDRREFLRQNNFAEIVMIIIWVSPFNLLSLLVHVSPLEFGDGPCFATRIP